MAKFRCSVCNWIYDETTEKSKFNQIPATYTCPVCGAPKSAFVSETSSKDDETITTNVAGKIVEQLVSFGVEYVCGIPGDSNLPLMEAIRKNENIRFILTRQEETAAFMASAHGKITDKLGVCMSIAGPGCTNLMTGLIDAATDKNPVLALAGQIPEVYLGSESFQEIDQLELFSTFTAYTETISRPNQALKLVLMATKYAYKKPGVSVLSTPTDVLSEKRDESIYNPDLRIFSDKSAPCEGEILHVAQLINESDKIAILAGWGARHSGSLLIKLAEKLKSPIATTSRAKGVIYETHKYSVGVLGSIGPKHAAHAVKNCELLIVIGSGFRQANLLPTGIKVIQIDIDATRVGKTINVNLGLVGDAGLILEKLVPLIQKKTENDQLLEYLKTIDKIKAKYAEEIKVDVNNRCIPVSPGYVIQAIKRNVNKDAIICTDVGDHTYWCYKKFVCDDQQTFMSANVASMGFVLPAALAAKLAHPEKQVVCISGDGGFGC